MSKLPSMPFLVDTYLADTTHLSLEEHGAYLLLLCAMWRRDGYLDDNDIDNARMLGLKPRDWQRLKQRLMPMLTKVGNRFTQKRLQIQWNFAQENRLRQSEKGKAGAKARIERNQALNSIRGLGSGSSTSDSTGSGTGSAREQASYKERDIPIPLSNTVEGETSETKLEKTELSRLLNTPLMKRHSA